MALESVVSLVDRRVEETVDQRVPWRVAWMVSLKARKKVVQSAEKRAAMMVAV